MIDITSLSGRQSRVLKVPSQESETIPVRDVEIKAFHIGKYEVTFEEYDRFAIATGRPLPWDNGWRRGNMPVCNVSWEDSGNTHLEAVGMLKYGRGHRSRSNSRIMPSTLVTVRQSWE